MNANEQQIYTMAERFLNWPLPKDFCPDGGISYQPNGTHPVGTNLLTYTQAVAMIRYMLDQPTPVEPASVQAPAEAAVVEPGVLFFCNDDTRIEETDDTRRKGSTFWQRTRPEVVGQKSSNWPLHEFRRRILAPASVSLPSVDLWQHEREEYRKAIEGLQAKQDKSEELAKKCDELQKLVNSKDGHNYYRLWGEATAELAELKRANAELYEQNKNMLINWVPGDSLFALTAERDSLQQQLEAATLTGNELAAKLEQVKAELAKAKPAVELLTTLMNRAYMRLNYREADEIANFLGVPSPIAHEMQDL